MNMPTVKAAITFVKTCEINKSDLNKMCKRFNIFMDEKATKEEMIERFVNSTLGVKLKNKTVNKHKTK